jgi:hypothetical protein
MRRKTADSGWNPYLAGALVGLLAIASVYATTQLMGKTSYLGASTTFVRAAGLLERAAAPERVAANEYFTKEKVRFDWQFMLVVGIFFGALISSATDRSFKLEGVPPISHREPADVTGTAMGSGDTGISVVSVNPPSPGLLRVTISAVISSTVHPSTASPAAASHFRPVF